MQHPHKRTIIELRFILFSKFSVMEHRHTRTIIELRFILLFSVLLWNIHTRGQSLNWDSFCCLVFCYATSTQEDNNWIEIHFVANCSVLEHPHRSTIIELRFILLCNVLVMEHPHKRTIIELRFILMFSVLLWNIHTRGQ